MPEDKKEIDRLRDENAALRRQLEIARQTIYSIRALATQAVPRAGEGSVYLGDTSHA